MFFLQDVDEKLLYDTFSAFGVIVTNPKVCIILSSCLVCIVASGFRFVLNNGGGDVPTFGW